MARATETFALTQPKLVGGADDTLRETFGRTLAKLIPDYPDLVVLDTDIASGTGAHHVRREHPNHFYQFGIAEQNMMAVAGGMAAVGLIPVVATLAVSGLRALEQARLQIAYARRNVKIVASHAGLDAGPDGGFAQCLEDLACFRAIPGMVVISPADGAEMESATKTILDYKGPVYMRSGHSPAKRIYDFPRDFTIGKGHVLREGRDVTIIACGVEVARALEAAVMLEAEGIRARVINMASIKPIDSALILRSALDTGCFVTAEDHNMHGGLGSAVAEVLATATPCPLEFVAVQDRFGQSGEPEELAERYGLTAPFIAAAAKRAIARKSARG